MNSKELKEEIANLEAEAKQILANTHFISGAITWSRQMLAKVEAKEKAEAAKIEQEVKQDASQSTNGTANT